MSRDSLVFFGTGPVSLACLEGIAGHFDIEAIITKPDKLAPNGRPHSAPVKAWAADHAIPLFQPATKAELAGLVTPGRFASRVGLVVDYGLIIPESVIRAFPLGIINSHFSLLPEWRGADPITFAILSGQAVTGVSVMLVVPALDEGLLLAQAQYQIPSDATTRQLTSALSDISNQLLIKTIPAYISNQIKPYPQDTSQPPTFSRKLTKADGDISWDKPADQIEREVRAFLGWPGSHTTLAGIEVTITAAHVASASDGPKALAVPCKSGALVIDRLKPAGKREMTGREFLAGHPIH
jgi:methionyl-tRNA formyltransferase